MDEIIKLTEIIDQSNNIDEKLNYIKQLHNLINLQKNELNNILKNDIDNIKIKIPAKYKKMSLEQLEELFNSTLNINEQITIYHTMNRIINNISDELFEED
jgi:hypothetical protein